MHTPLGTARLSERRKNHLAPLGVLLALALASPLQAKPSGETGRSPKKPPANAEKLIRILEPDVSPLESHPVDIVVRLHPSADSDTFRASLNGQDITRQFRRQRHQRHKRLASVGAGHGLVTGQNRLRVRVQSHGRRRDVDVREFELVTRGVGDVLPTSESFVRVQARVGTGPYSIIVEGQPPYGSGTDPGANANGLLIVALNRETLTLKPQGQKVFATGSADCKPIVDFLHARALGDIVIVAATGASGQCNKEVGQALAPFGANAEIAGWSASSPFTFIGIKGLGYDQAFYGIDNLVGYFAQDSYANYTFIMPDYVKFVVKDPAVLNPSNVITIGGTPYPPKGLDGFQVLVVDRRSLIAISNRFYATHIADGSLTAMQEMAADLNAINDENLLVFVSNSGRPFPNAPDTVTLQVHNSAFDKVHGTFTIQCKNKDEVVPVTTSFEVKTDQNVPITCPPDHPSYAAPEWSWTHTGSFEEVVGLIVERGWPKFASGLPAAISRFGGNPYTFEQLGHYDDYALVASVSPGYEKAPAFPYVESSSSMVSGVETFSVSQTGSIRGVLGRGRRLGRYEPVASDFDLAVPIDYDLYSLAFQPPTPWTFPVHPKKFDGTDLCPSGIPTEAGLHKAYVEVSRYLIGTPTDHSDPDLRAHYADQPPLFTTWQNLLTGLTYPTTDPGYSAQEFCMVTAELSIEVGWADGIFGAGGLVKSLSDRLDKLKDPGGTIETVVADLGFATDSQPDAEAGIELLKLFGALLEIVVPEGLPKEVMGVVSEVLVASTKLASTSEGGPRDTILVAAKNLKTESQLAVTEIKASLIRLFELIVSDYGKMKIVGQRMHDSDPAWVGPANNAILVDAALELALRRHYYKQLMPLAFTIVEWRNTTWWNKRTADDCGLKFNPHALFPARDVDPGGPIDGFILAQGLEHDDYGPPPDGLTDTLFRNVEELETALGVPKAEFYIRWPLGHDVCLK